MVKYQELIYELNAHRYNVYILDHRGQGYSQRLDKNSTLGDVNSFNDYVKDMHFFVKKFLPKSEKNILLAHSMGGAIASLYLEKYTNDFQALLLSSPMHQPNILGSLFSGKICQVIEKREKGLSRYIKNLKSYDEALVSFEENTLTHSALRYKIMKIAFDINPETKVGDPTIHWVSEACSASLQSVTHAEKITIPILLLQAKDDEIVLLSAQDQFCKRAKRCHLEKIEGAYHELFIEKDSIRTHVIKLLLAFIEKV